MGPKLPRPTDAELAILNVLWNRGPSTVREIQVVLERARPTGYTTVLKLLQLITEKGVVRRDATERIHVYEACLTEQQIPYCAKSRPIVTRSPRKPHLTSGDRIPRALRDL